MKGLTGLVLFSGIFLSACASSATSTTPMSPASGEGTPSRAAITEVTETPVPTVEVTLPPSPTPSPSPSPILPVGTVVCHPADSNIIWDWYTYIPPHLDKARPVIIFLVGMNANNWNNYGENRHDSYLGLQDAISRFPDIDSFVLLTPVIPHTILESPILLGHKSLVPQMPSTAEPTSRCCE